MPTPVDLHVGRALRSRRRILGLTQAQVATIAGVSFQQVQKYETGANCLSVARLVVMARALEAPAASFLPAEDPGP